MRVNEEYDKDNVIANMKGKLLIVNSVGFDK